MSDVFEMPNNAESYYRKAQNLIEQKEYLQAADLLEKSYQLQPNFIVFNELVKLYLSFKIKDKLQTLWESYYPNQEDIYVDEELSFLYGLSLPVIYESQTALLALYQLKEIAHQSGWATEHLIKSINELNDQNLFENSVRKAVDKQTSEQLLDHLLEKGSFYLLSRIKVLYDMPYVDIEMLVRTLLKSDQVLHYIKSDLLHYLINQKIEDTFEYRWFGKDFSFSIPDLKPYREDSTYQKGLWAIQQYCDTHNPHLVNDISQQFTMHVMIYYPFLKEVISSASKWLDIFLVQNGLEEEADTATLDETLFDYYQLANEELFVLLTPPSH